MANSPSLKAVAWLTPDSIAHLAKQSGVSNVPAWNCSNGSERVPVYTHAPAAEPQGMGGMWKPIETMPRELHCLVYGLDCDGRGGYWKSYGLRSYDSLQGKWVCLKVAYPSHWMPLPEPPK